MYANQKVQDLEFAIGDHVLLKISPMKGVLRYELSGDSSSAPNGLTGLFYQTYGDIVGTDVYNIVKALFEDHTLPKAITHTNLVLLAKKNDVETSSDMRPNSLSNFINKVISRVLHDKQDKVLPNLTSSNQSSFVKGRNIIENVLLTQEIVTDFGSRRKPSNIVIKLDITKASDGAHEFFHSTRGVKQGDPLSPPLSILSAEVVTRAPNSLFEKHTSLKLIISTLKDYEDISGQKINKGKSFFLHALKDERVEDVKDLMGENGWDTRKLQQLFLEDIVNHITTCLKIKEISEI
ncbi:uncharacterized protein LOC132612965 [Lycium barbarum]|uniref:uncharacterized protein LOC132612965 n=1 Tax=Lycium barbarum TaxID=112863 RepID=UPI00293E9903|nr:uncharacterized protein LOC132612965 [Lycium barbarum]